MRATVPRRWVALCAIGVAVLGLHGALLWVLGPAWFDPDTDIAPPLPLRAVQVRSVVLAPPPPTPAPVVADVLTSRKPAARVAPHGAPASAPAERVPEAAPEPVAPVQASVAEASLDTPVYATRLPPAGLWRYRMQRGVAVGVADLNWAPQAEAGYELRLEGRVAGVTMLEWASRGQIDAAGLAPERFVLRRRGRDRHAANFQREAGKITFSGPQTEYPLHPGAQDRLSWMIQLGAIVAAEPALSVAGAKVVLFVSGAHGDAGVWSFVNLGPEAVESRAGDVAAIRFRREPRGPYDTTVEVWLDPQRHHLPVRATLRAGPNDDGLDLRLQDMDTTP